MSILNIIRGVTGEVELGRVLWALATVALIAYQGLAIFLNHQDYSAIEFGTGAAAILAAGGFGVAAKDKGVATAMKEKAQ